MSDHECDTGFFDRTICPEPCGAMHSYCTICGASAESCANEVGIRREPLRSASLLSVRDAEITRLGEQVQRQADRIFERDTMCLEQRAEITRLREERDRARDVAVHLESDLDKAERGLAENRNWANRFLLATGAHSYQQAYDWTHTIGGTLGRIENERNAALAALAEMRRLCDEQPRYWLNYGDGRKIEMVSVDDIAAVLAGVVSTEPTREDT